MSSVINTNITSLNAQRNLSTSQSALQTALQRLSSGLRINSAKDDAAGLAISDRMTTQINGLNQAVRNANDGTSLAQTGEGALAQITDNLQRIRTLAVQAANASNSSTDRATLDAEVQQRLAEIDRVAAQTSFNGQKILDGTFGTAQFQVGANVGETIAVNLSTSTRYTTIGKTADYVGGSAYLTTSNAGQQGTGVDATNALASGDMTIAIGSGQAVTVGASAAGSAAGQNASSAYAKVAAINAAGIGGLTTTADTTVGLAFTTFTGAVGTNTYTLSVNGQAIYTAGTGTYTGSDVAAAINSNASATGVTAAFSSGVLTLNAADGRDISISQSLGAGATANQGLDAASGTNNTVNTALDMSTGAGATVAQKYVGSIHMTSSSTIDVAGTNPAYAGFTTTSYALGAAALNSVAVTTVNNANTAITRIDAALTAVDSLRATFGALQNRFDSVVANLMTSAENLTAARSRIQDADFAQETANLTRAQILQQAGTAMLAQANALPQQVLTLLK